jgi:hypothetical protein
MQNNLIIVTIKNSHGKLHIGYGFYSELMEKNPLFRFMKNEPQYSYDNS